MLRTFAEISGLNIVIDPAVQGTVDVALRDVPWDQALDIILRANKLGYSVDGTIVRIAPLDGARRRRRTSARQARRSAGDAGELGMLQRQLSYAKGEEMRDAAARAPTSRKRGTVRTSIRAPTR